MNKFTASILVVLVVVGFLLFKAFKQGTSLYIMPSQLAKDSAADPAVKMSRIRVIGRVSTDPVKYEVEPEIKLEFSIHDPEENAGVVPVVYRGIKPDMFAAGRDVIIDGDFVDGELIATKLLTQCPSKYEPPEPGQAKSRDQAMNADTFSASDTPRG